MSGIEEKIKDFAKEQGVAIVGVAGPDRLDDPPSLDPTYTMKGYTGSARQCLKPWGQRTTWKA